MRFLSWFLMGIFGRFKLLMITVEGGEIDAQQGRMPCPTDGANVEANLRGPENVSAGPDWALANGPQSVIVIV
ncbi:hypothetical protein Tco_1216850 [Tanacetum coccineum]